jgi:L-rhamnose mutarotase
LADWDRHHEALRFCDQTKTQSLEAYQKYHAAAVWPEVLATIRRCNIRNYSIYLKVNLLALRIP